MSKPQFIRGAVLYFAMFMLIQLTIVCQFANIPVFIQLCVDACLCVYIGCFFAQKIEKDKEGAYKKCEYSEDQEIMQASDAMKFPIIGSCILFSLYLLYKFVNKEILSIIFTIHFTFIGVLCLAKFLDELCKPFQSGKLQSGLCDKKWNIPLYGELKVKFTHNQLYCFIVALFPTAVYVFSRHWISNNIFGISFSIIGIEQMILPNFKTGFILLWGLFFYDIFWVYGTDVMVTVAKSFDAPIKLMFPYNWNADPPQFSMLGLGDIVIPGIFVALCLKYDVYRFLKTGSKNLGEMKLGYFNWCFGGYILGIITTFAVMIIWNHPQPALLFLVPGCTFAVLLKALIFGELKELFEYDETIEKTDVTTKGNDDTQENLVKNEKQD